MENTINYRPYLFSKKLPTHFHYLTQRDVFLELWTSGLLKLDRSMCWYGFLQLNREHVPDFLSDRLAWSFLGIGSFRDFFDGCVAGVSISATHFVPFLPEDIIEQM